MYSQIGFLLLVVNFHAILLVIFLPITMLPNRLGRPITGFIFSTDYLPSHCWAYIEAIGFDFFLFQVWFGIKCQQFEGRTGSRRQLARAQEN